ncbi:DUF1826 domain-containing protein [Azotobacter salinestris]|uniref:DUF1826 domain-containing protein n=1 Tax=Azotobacter salinestris TaxID=69964 RepID=UPI001266C01F|nr:DUF1826 domain-containing protein [Azotobacter salinestris]
MRGATIQRRSRQVRADSPAVLADVLEDGVNMALWQRRLPRPVERFAALLARGAPLALSLVLELDHPEAEPDLSRLAEEHVGAEGRAEFIADVAWLVSAFACLVDARRVGLRLRSLETAMCPRFHVDRVPLRLVTTYYGAGSQWLLEGAMARARLGDASAEPGDVLQIEAGAVALFKGEKWLGNEGAGIIHRSPRPESGKSRLLLTLDWLA